MVQRNVVFAVSLLALGIAGCQKAPEQSSTSPAPNLGAVAEALPEASEPSGAEDVGEPEAERDAAPAAD